MDSTLKTFHFPIHKHYNSIFIACLFGRGKCFHLDINDRSIENLLLFINFVFMLRKKLQNTLLTEIAKNQLELAQKCRKTYGTFYMLFTVVTTKSGSRELQIDHQLIYSCLYILCDISQILFVET